MKKKIILMILNCKKNSIQRKRQRETWISTLPSHIKYFHIIGEPKQKEEILVKKSHNLISLRCEDDYLHLPKKVIMAMKAINQNFSFDYLFKTDDDQNLINHNFFGIIDKVLSGKSSSFLDFFKTKREKYHYGGYSLKVKEHYSTYHEIHDCLPKKVLLEKNIYCNGRFYFLSREACLSLLKFEREISERIIEDHAIGLYLEKSLKKNLCHIKTDKFFSDFS